LRVLHCRLRLGVVLTLPLVLAITHVGTACLSLLALANLRFLAGGLIRAMFISFLLLVLASEIEAELVFVSVEHPTLVWALCPFAPTELVEVLTVR
jgi:hypothetical protein